ncbi:uncharacterized protein [Anabrus simplex]|uniref:uncharacterized protein isoform X1 n=1 Tax=Anabrus simplex TaxID=316456 RepID=UPI0035A35CB3
MGLKSGAKSGKGAKSNGKLSGGKFQQPNIINDSGSDDEPQIDASVLRQSIDLSVKRFTDLIKIFTSGTNEIKNILDHQCDIIYECKVCKNLFRSLANFISHKRVYCRREYCAAEHTRNRNDVVEDYTWVVQPEPAPSGSRKTQNWITSDVKASSDQPGAQIATVIPPISTYSKPKKDLSKIIERLGQKASVKTITETMGHISATHLYEDISKKVVARNNDRKEHAIHLENMETTKVGVFQTKLCTTTTTTTTTSAVRTDNTDLMKAQISEIQNIESDNEAILDSNGRIVTVNGPTRGDKTTHESTDNPSEGGNSKEEHVCEQCNQRFSTRKTLSHHVKSLHVMFRMCYPCPCCKSIFVNTWSVYRHLYKVHRKSTAQVRKLRPQIQKKAFKRDTTEESPTTPGKVKNATLKELQRLDQDWMNNFEDDQELQRCGGCGRRFERRAALNSHSQICQKRIAARNNIKLTRLPGSSSNGVEKVLKQESVEFTNNPKKTEVASPNKTSVSPLQVETNSCSSSNSPYSRVPAQQTSAGSWCEQTKKDIPEKRIEIQIRRDYIKIGSGGSSISLLSDAQSESSSRPHSCAAGEEGEDCEVWEVNKFGQEIVNSQEETNSMSSSKQLARECRNISVNSARETDGDDSIEVIGEVTKSNGNGEFFSNTVQQIQYKSVDKSNDSFSFNPKCPVESSRSGTSKEPDQTSKVSNTFVYSSVHCSETRPALAEQEIIISGNVQVSECNKRKRPSSTIVRHRPNAVSHYDIDSEDSKTEDSQAQKTVKVSPTKKPKKVIQLSPVMENRMQELINVRRLQCLPCQKKFNKLTNLRRHVAIHMGWNRYQCMLCHHKCFSKYDCVAHVSKVHLKGGLRTRAMTMVKYIEAQAQESGAATVNHIPVRHTSVVKLTQGDDFHQAKTSDLSFHISDSSAPSIDKFYSCDSAKVVHPFSGVIKSDEVKLEPEVYSIHSSPCSNENEDNKDYDLGTPLESLVKGDEVLLSSSHQITSSLPSCTEMKQEPDSHIRSLSNGDLSDVKAVSISGEKVENEDACSVTDDTFIPQTNEGNMSPTHQDPNALKKMVMEVIFGSGSDTNIDPNQTPLCDVMNGVNRDNQSSRPSSTASELEPHLEQIGDSSVITSSPLEVSSNIKPSSSTTITVIETEPVIVENERRERPVRNRVRVTRDDFIYDLSDACLNPKKEPDSHSNHSVSRSAARRKQYDSVKELLKQGGLEHTSIANNFEVLKCVPKLMLVRTDGGESNVGKRVNVAAKGTWSSFSSSSSDCSSEKDLNSSHSSGGYNISTRKSQRVFDTKPIKTVDHAKDK